MFVQVIRVALVCLAASLLGGCVSMIGRAVSDHDPDQLVQDAQTTFDDLLRDRDNTWVHNNLAGAKAVLIAPRVVRAGLLYGGSGGRAVLVARRGNQWIGPAFYDLGSVSVGFQAGADVSHVVLLVMTQKALDSLMSDSFKLGGDVSVAAGPVGAGAESTVTADIVAFSRDKGVYGGINLEGSMIHPNSKWNAEYYGRADVRPADILSLRNVASRKAAPLLAAVARAPH